jgi:CDP-paratose 2-epimerase
VRDILWIDDLVEAMRLATGRIDEVAGSVFNVGGGPENAVSVRVRDRAPARDHRARRSRWCPSPTGGPATSGSTSPTPRRIGEALGWRPRTGWKAGLEQLAGWLEELEEGPAVLPLEPPAAARTAGAPRLARVAP